jgi:Co/Zn/Cd efflux system component
MVYTEDNWGIRRTVFIVGSLNFLYFFVEFYVAQIIGSVSLFADSVDFLEDAAVNFLIFLAIGWSLHSRSIVGVGLAGILLIPGGFTLWTAWSKFVTPVPPDAFLLSTAAIGALGVNIFCAFLLARFRRHSGSLTRAAFLSARNDAIANVAIILAALVTMNNHSAWPDLIVGLMIFLINLDAAREVFRAARQERSEAIESAET